MEKFIPDKMFHIDKYYTSPPLFGDIRLIQIGKMHCTKCTVIEEHVQREHQFELTAATGGKGKILTNGVPVDIETNQIYLSLPGDLHRIESDSKNPLKFIFFAFSPENAEMHNMLEKIAKLHSSPTERMISNENTEYLLGTAINEINDFDEFSEKILAAVFGQIVWNTIRDFLKFGEKNTALHIDDKTELCYQIMNYINTHIYSITYLSDISDVFAYNYSYLSDLFKTVTGDTLQNYYKTRRLYTASLLLADGVSVKTTAEMLQYSSMYSFSRAFKSEYGISPSKYHIAK